MRSLLTKVSIGDYLAAAAAGIGLGGAAAELNAALEVPTVGAGGGIAVPWRLLLPDGGLPEVRQSGDDPESRAFTTTTNYAGGVAQRPILQRLFGMDIMDALGVRIDTVPAGRTEWPLITAGVAPDQKAEGTAATAPVAATFSSETLKPKRLTGAYEYTHELAAQVVDLEPALRRDMADAVSAKMNDLIINGDEATNSQEPDGFATTITAPSDASATAVYADYAGSHAQAVDGIHASIGNRSRVGGRRRRLQARRDRLSGRFRRVRFRSAEAPGHEVHGEPVRRHGSQHRSAQVEPVPRRGPQRWRHARRLGRGRLADPRNHPRHLLEGEPGRRADVGCPVGRADRFPGRGVRPLKRSTSRDPVAQLAHVDVGDTPVDLTLNLEPGCYLAQVRSYGDLGVLYATVPMAPADESDYFAAPGGTFFTFTAGLGVAATWAKTAAPGVVIVVAVALTDA